MYYSCINWITIGSVMNIDKKNHTQVYLEECKHRIKKTQIPKVVKLKLNQIQIQIQIQIQKLSQNGKIRKT